MSENTEQQSQTTAESREVTAPATPTVGGARPSPSAIKPSAIKKPAPSEQGATSQPVTPVSVDETRRIAEASTFGSVDEDGTVHVRDGEETRTVGQIPDSTPDEALAFYARRYLDLDAKVTLFEVRLTTTDLSVKEIDSTLAKLNEETASPSAVGDLPSLRARVEALSQVAAKRREELEVQRAAAKQVAFAKRTEIVERAEKIAGTDPSKIQWRPAGEELRALLEQWKEAQRSGPRLDKAAEDSLWKRFSHARTTFDRERRHFFSELEKQNASAKEVKSSLVEQAEKLSTSTEWNETAAAYRELMNQWKAAGRASRKDDDALWARFRGAQDAFFARREEANAAINAEFEANLVVKEALLVRAEALVPVKDLSHAKTELRSIQDAWETAGKVPRNDIQRVEGRLRAVERAIKDAEQSQWDRTNPETRARAEGALAQLEQGIEQLEADLAAAQAAGKEKKVKELTSALEARRSWLEQIKKAADESRG
ncbi:DUF349 domain-containing protein [Jonesia quinghaiensis]|uniref:DUF349 domain-containing protein n=1 Tax=Jonesia quinghaiensis TaxID=262806 RepID=UPI00040A2DFE|nr:DUF349 domain-containing protein [Jonesia quinghaiensis]